MKARCAFGAVLLLSRPLKYGTKLDITTSYNLNYVELRSALIYLQSGNFKASLMTKAIESALRDTNKHSANNVQS
ncbi:hypothetical protein DKT75_15460 [Leucothrix arctica]|uniref:Uncharacterized protein n=1 Tax=Leucothrix arctica TaxID=1481894 RepID=A0A317C8R1_9GAMM|nr:hypothetical protein DKT75_15460 [Leucothrix arctica]